MTVTAKTIAADLELAARAKAELLTPMRVVWLDYTNRAQEALPEYAKAYREAVVILDRLMKEQPHGKGCSCNWCTLLAAYHAQEKAE